MPHKTTMLLIILTVGCFVVVFLLLKELPKAVKDYAQFVQWQEHGTKPQNNIKK